MSRNKRRDAAYTIETGPGGFHNVDPLTLGYEIAVEIDAEIGYTDGPANGDPIDGAILDSIVDDILDDLIDSSGVTVTVESRHAFHISARVSDVNGRTVVRVTRHPAKLGL